MIVVALQAAAEYIGVMLGGLVRNLERGAQDLWRWLGDNPIAIVIAFVVLLLLRRLRAGR